MNNCCPDKARFMVDHMLVKLGKYLRILGYDAEWQNSADARRPESRLRTHELIRIANVDGRIFLTRNTRITGMYPEPDRMLVLRDTDPVCQLKEVVQAFGLDDRSGLFTRCIRCNVGLIPIADKESVRPKVHPNVFARFDRFFTCPSCHTVFWHGTHVTNTRRKLGIE